MKSAAFNLAFKVHKNEMSFADGLLKSAESNAQEDFIEALNSLAGSQKYNVDQIDTLISKAKQDLSQDKSQAGVDLEAIEKEIRDFRLEVREIKNSIHFIEAKNASMLPTILPGMNSLLIFLIGAVALLILFALAFILSAILVLIITVIGCGMLFYIDSNKLARQKEAIARKQAKNQEQIDNLNGQIEEIHKKIAEKEAVLAKHKAAQEAPTPSSPPPPTPGEVDLPPIF